jgi:hypothetical protein
MDLGYTVFVGIYYSDANEARPSEDIEEFPLGENSILSLIIYTLDFFICMILLALFYMYAKKASDDEEKLKRYYLMSVGQKQFLQDVNHSDSDNEFASEA